MSGARDSIAAAKRALADRWHRFSAREQGLILLLAVAALVVAGYYGAYRPLVSASATARRDLATYRALNARLAAADLTAPVATGRRTGSPAEVVRAAAADIGLGGLRVSGSSDAVQATLADVPFDTLIAWIAEVERSTALRASRVEVRRGADPGLVAASVAFRS